MSAEKPVPNDFPLGPEEYHKLRVRALHKVIASALEKTYKQDYQDDPEKFFAKSLLPATLERYPEEVGQLTKSQNERYCSNTQLKSGETFALFVTFSPDPELDVDWSRVIKQMTKPCKGVQKIYLCIEQRGIVEEEMGIGVHIHALYNLADGQNGERARNVKRIKNMLQSYRTKTDHFLDIKFVSREKMQSKIDYIKGEKEKEEKQASLQINEIWREEMGYPPYWEL